MKINYDPQTDSAYIKLSEGKYKMSKKVSKEIIVDYDSTGSPIGIEILSAKENIKDFPQEQILVSKSLKNKSIDENK